MSPAQYLDFERDAEFKHEYHDGKIVAMAGGSPQHSLLAVNLGSELRQQLKRRPCLVFNSDMKVWVARERHYFYPDLSGLCGKPEYLDGTRDVLLNPSFVVEVLSPKTEGYDRGKKLARYMALPSLIEIALVSQEEVRVDKYTRQADGIWAFEGLAGFDAVLRFVSVDCAIPLRDFYEGIELLTPEEATAYRLREEEPAL